MPAKGQDIDDDLDFSRQADRAVCLALGLALVFQGTGFRAFASEFMASPALIFLSGVITLPAGLAIVLTHNVWTADWRVVITIVGWLAVVTGAIRMIVPQRPPPRRGA